MIEIIRSKSGIPCLWEQGGGYTNTGYAVVITDKNGKAKKPIYIKRRGHLACEKHALIPIRKGDYFIRAHHHRKDFNIVVRKIKKIKDNTAEVEEVAEYSMGEWSTRLPEHLKSAVEAAKAKALHYHCRIPYYIKEVLKDEGNIRNGSDNARTSNMDA